MQSSKLRGPPVGGTMQPFIQVPLCTMIAVSVAVAVAGVIVVIAGVITVHVSAAAVSDPRTICALNLIIILHAV